MPEKADIQRLNFGQTISTQCVTDAILIIYNNNKNNKETNAFSQKDNKKALFFIVMHFVIMSSKWTSNTASIYSTFKMPQKKDKLQ